jgi:predicted lipoprotein with Yx(FWY)xxD motif
MRNNKLLVSMLILLVAGLAYAADMPAGVQTMKISSGMTVLADAKGMTLYTYGKDETGKSNCNGPCAMNWPPLTAAADAKTMGDWTVVTRDDASKQWAYKGKPLYKFARDTKAGDITGDGAGQGAWHIALP